MAPAGRAVRRVLVRAASLTVVIGLGLGVGGCSSPTSGGTAGTTRTTVPGTNAVSAGGYRIDVPRDILVRSTAACPVLASSAVITGSFTELSTCPLDSARGTVVLFGTGGPPLSPVPIYFDGDRSFNGVAVQVLVGASAGGVGVAVSNYLLALLPGLTTWIEMVVPGPSVDFIPAVAQQILSTLHVLPGSPVTTATGSGDGTMLGHWDVHDATLDVVSATTAVLAGQNGGCVCLEQDTLTLSASADASQIMAVVTKITFVNGEGAVLPYSTARANSPIGERSMFEFVAPHLMLQAMLDPPTRIGTFQEGIGNIYWCGPGLNPMFSQACGA